MAKARMWSDDEVDAVVVDYFAMVDAYLAGRPFVKAHHTRALQTLLDNRTRPAVEQKRHNISAALAERNLRWLPGYVPKDHHQQALVDAVDVYLASRPQLVERLRS